MKLIDAYWQTLRPSVSEIEAELDRNLARRKAVRLEPDPHRRGWLTRFLNRN